MADTADLKTIHIYLSPHLDDVVLSCGGRIWQQAQAGERVLVVTVFAGAPAPDAPLSPFARELHARWGYLADAMARRQEEDLTAVALLGAKAIHWPYTDCIYRQTPGDHFPYASEGALWGEIHPAENGLLVELAARIAALPSSWDGAHGLKSVMYAPLAIGHHVDHQIVRHAACNALVSAALGWGQVHYEDYPYAQDPQAVQAALRFKPEPTETQWRAEVTPLSEGALEAKIVAIACYHSQLSTFWTSLAEMTAAIQAFAERTGGGRPAERYWRSTLP
jgi:LmbE family N-acetylglucosaminyl deacetylase